MTTSNPENLYGFDQETPEQLGNAPIPPGINENVKLVDVAYEPAKEGSSNMCLAFYFEDEEQRQLRHCEWPIDPEEVKQRAAKRGDDPATALQKKVRAQGVRVKHIVTKVIPPDRAAVGKVSSFQQYAQAVVNLIKGALPAGPLRLKVVLSDKDYSSLTPYTPFVERQTEAPTGLKIGKGERLTPAKKAGGGGLEMPGDLDGPTGGPAGGGEGLDDDPPF